MNYNKSYRQLAMMLRSGINHIDFSTQEICELSVRESNNVAENNVAEYDIQTIKLFLAHINAKSRTILLSIYRNGSFAYTKNSIYVSSYSQAKLDEILCLAD